jgi:hypothetical protein
MIGLLLKNELERIWKEAVAARHLPGGLRKTANNLSQVSLSRGQDLNPGPPEYEAGGANQRTISSSLN